jgi:hypothetical protein
MNRCMKFHRRCCLALCILCLALCSRLPAQTLELSGYVSDMASGIRQHPGDGWWWENLLHNRLNFTGRFSENWKLNVGMRNRIIAGDLVSAGSVDADPGWMDLSWNVLEGKDALLNTSLDRLYLAFEKGKWNVQLGRQRINWGQTLVWNPNDIFNTYSFFDFDYAERSGCDALRSTYYHTETAFTEVAASISRSGRVTAAALHQWNLHNFDYRIMGGVYAQSDMVVGGAWTGDFSGLNFRGEFSLFRPMKHFSDTGTVIAASVGLDYIFPNSLSLQAEALYNTVGNAALSGGLMDLYAAPLSAKHLSVCEWNLFGQASCPLSPRLTSSVSSMYFVELRSLYAGFSLDCSLLENLDLSLISQYFVLDGATAGSDMRVFLGFLKLKYSF